MAQIAKTAGKAWPELGVIPDHAQALEQDLERVLIAIFTADFSIYEAFMAERGSKLDEIAKGFADAMIEYGLYDPKQPELAEDLPDADRVRYIWNNPTPRRMAFAVVDSDSTRPGIGFNTMNNSPDWPHPDITDDELLAPPQDACNKPTGRTVHFAFCCLGDFSG